MAWTYLPNYHSLQAQGGGFWEQNTFMDSGPSVMLNGTNTRRRSSKKGSKMDSSMTPQSGTTSLPSTEGPLMDLLISSLRDSRASHSALRATALQKMIRAMDGRPRLESFAKLDPESSVWKTFQASFLSNTLEPFSGSWPARAIVLDMTAFRLKKLGHHTLGTGSGSWPTVRAKEAGDYQYSGKDRKKVLTLIGKIKQTTYQTPIKSDSRGSLGTKRGNGKPKTNLARQVKDMYPTPRHQDGAKMGTGSLGDKKILYPTPAAQDGKNSTLPMSQMIRDTLPGAVLRIANHTEDPSHWPTESASGWGNEGSRMILDRRIKSGDIPPEEKGRMTAGHGGQLNPEWVEWLMGWPIGWTSLEPLPRENLMDWLEKTKAGTWWLQDPAEVPYKPAGKKRGRIIPRIVKETKKRIQRIECLGNGQVPACVGRV